MPGERVWMLWRYGAPELIISCLGLELVLLAYQLYLGPAAGLRALIFWTALEMFLLWRIWRGGKVAWVVLVLLDAAAVGVLVLGQAWPWDWSGTGLLAIVAAQLIMLVSPAVRHHLQARARARGEPDRQAAAGG